VITSDTLRRIAHFDSAGLPVVSAYVGLPARSESPRAARSRLSSMLSETEATTSDGDLDHDARLSVREDLARIREAAPTGPPGAGAVALFACSGRGFFEQVRLPRHVRDRLVVDGTPWTRPMLAVLDEFHRAGVVVLDRADARLWELFQDELGDELALHDTALRGSRYAGWHGLDERHVHDKAEELRKRHFSRVADTVRTLARERGWELLVVGGHHEEVSLFVPFLPHGLRERVAGTFAADPGTVRPAEVQQAAAKVVEDYERLEEVRWVEDALGLHAAGGLAVVGVEDCLWAASVKAVQLLLVQDEATVPGLVCPRCGWLGARGQTRGPCPVCGAPTSATGDVLEELAEAVIDNSGTVEHVSAQTRLAEHLCAAVLRFPLPAAPSAE
jgi:peptide chain release factor subunit 1